MDKEAFLTLTADIVAAHVSNNTLDGSDLSRLIRSVFGALSTVGEPKVVEEVRIPAVSIRSSVKPDAIVCLDCGAKQKMLKRHLAVRHQLTPDSYRARWNLPASYPMVASTYATLRQKLAKDIGLGRKKGSGAAPKPAADKTSRAATGRAPTKARATRAPARSRAAPKPA